MVQQNNVKLLPVEHCSAIDRLLDYVPDLMEKANCMLNKSMQNKKEEMKNQDKIKKQVKEILEKDEEPIVTAQVKARPKHAKVPRPEPIEYDYEYDETEDSNKTNDNKDNNKNNDSNKDIVKITKDEPQPNDNDNLKDMVLIIWIN